MNRGVLQSSPVQQMAGNPNWWSINNNMKPPPHEQPSSPLPPPLFPQYPPASSSSSIPLSLNYFSCHDNQDLPESWSQLLLGGLMGEEDRAVLSHFQANKKLENWDHEQVMYPSASAAVVDVKQEVTESGYMYGRGNEEFQAVRPNWSPVMPASSPRSRVTNFSSNMLDFSNGKADGRPQQPDHSSECNSTASGGAFKKARVQPSSTQPSFKVRKEKLGDRITALHQLVSPFGKTDTASVLLEALGYIRFLQNQVEALSSPYLGSESGNIRHQQQSVQGERNCIFPEDPGQLLNDNCMKRRRASELQNAHDALKMKDLRSRGLCLVPVSCTLQVGNDNGADFWAPTFGGGFQ